MSRNQAEQPDVDEVSGAGNFFQSVQPQRDLESNWAVDLAKNLEEYLLKICSGEVSDKDDSHLSINFAEAALLLQGSILVYSRKVEYLYSLVLHALEFISQKSVQDQTPNGDPDQPIENGQNGATSEDNDTFWVLDDITVDPKNSLDNNAREAPLNQYVRPPANLVVLEGDCLDTTGETGELESYLLANSDLYRDFILLDSCDSIVVNEYLKRNVEVENEKTPVRSKSRKSVGPKSVRKTPSLTPVVNHGSDFDNNNINHDQYDSPGNNNDFGFGIDDNYMNNTDLENSDEDNEDDDPWKPLNPHEPGTLKTKPYKRVKANKRRDLGSKKHILCNEFPLAKLNGTISLELNEIWESRKRVMLENESKSPLYEKLRNSLVSGVNIDGDNAFNNPMDNNENNGDDSEDDLDMGPHDFDMPDIDNEFPQNFNENNDEGVHFNNDEVEVDPNSQTSLEDLCRSHLDALLANLSETEKQTEMAARVSTWKQRIEENLEEQDARPPFDIHLYGDRIMDKLSSEAEPGKNPMSFGDVVKGQEKHDVARTFSALLQLVNNGDVDLEKSGIGSELTCYTSENPFHVRYLKNGKNRGDNMKMKFSKKRAKSPILKSHGKENTSSSLSSPSSKCRRISIKAGKSGSTPQGKKRRKSRNIEPVVDL